MNNSLDEMLKEAPSLTFEPFSQPEVMDSTALAKEEEAPKIPEVVLTPDEQKMVDDFASKILALPDTSNFKIGRASCRERVSWYV